jgi:hypothetical protein
MALALLPLIANAEEINISLDRCAILNSNDDSPQGKIALHFPLPDSMEEVFFAEIIISLPVQPQGGDSLLELHLFPLLVDWQENDIDFDGSASITDSMSTGSSMIKLGGNRQFHIDITPYIKDIMADSRANYGFMVLPELLGGQNISIPDNQDTPIRNSATVRIIYR